MSTGHTMRQAMLLRESDTEFILRGKQLANDFRTRGTAGALTISAEGPTVNLTGVLYVLPQSRRFELHLEMDGLDSGSYVAGAASESAAAFVIEKALSGRLCSAEILIGSGDEPSVLVACEAKPQTARQRRLRERAKHGLEEGNA